MIVIVSALCWDKLLGEPHVRIHPVVWMGNCIAWMRKKSPSSAAASFLWGLLMVILLPLCFALLAVLSQIPLFGIAFAIWLLKSSFAVRGLIDAGLNVAVALDQEDLGSARTGLRSLCSRNADKLDATLVSAAATESVAENCSDSLVAPLFWYAFAGLPGALVYRCVNTLDAMVGYRGKYEWLGKASARTDDLLNLVPARLCSVLLIVAGWLTPGADAKTGISVLLKDRNLTSSPNAGWPMAAMAGLLGVELEKPEHYVIGKGLAASDADKLRLGCVLSERAMLLTAALLLLALLLAAVL